MYLYYTYILKIKQVIIIYFSFIQNKFLENIFLINFTYWTLLTGSKYGVYAYKYSEKYSTSKH